MACDCLSKFDDNLKARGQRVSVAIYFDTEGRTWEMPAMSAEFRSEHKKKRGERPYTIKPTFCPFCGTRYMAEDIA